MIIRGDCLLKLKEMPDSSVDSIVTDPPWAIKFMSKKWDYSIPSIEVWREALRVLKPGGHMLVCCGTRTQHRMVVSVEDAGFEVRDVITHLYGSGFPKSHDISKAIDKQAGVEREIVGHNPSARPNHGNNPNLVAINQLKGECNITAPATPDAIKWQGFGTALKPSCEFWTLCRKPLSEKTVAENVLKWSTGGLNVDASRIGYQSDTDMASATPQGKVTSKKPSDGYAKAAGVESERHEIERPALQGRFPANTILGCACESDTHEPECAVAMLDRQSGVLKSGKFNQASKKAENSIYGKHDSYSDPKQYDASIGGASRFFYCAKSSKSERNAGLEGEVKEKQGARPNSADSTGKFPDHDHRPSGGNNHPTVKPIKLMEYLIRLITPSGGTILDPFCGSGSTGVAAKRLGFNFIGIEMNGEYCSIAEKRINA